MYRMDDVMLRQDPRDEADLAAIVLGTERWSRERPVGAPERVPAWMDHSPVRGYDARSVAVLGLVVAVLAGLVGWLTTFDEGSRVTPPAPARSEASSTGATGPAATVADPAPQPAGPATSLPEGVDLAAGRLTLGASGAGFGLVTLSVRNAGADDLASSGASVLLLVDGAVVGAEQLGPLASGAAARVVVPLGWCPAGEMPVVAVIDPGSLVREANVRNNALSQRASFGC